jgi:hypothetical protein
VDDTSALSKKPGAKTMDFKTAAALGFTQLSALYQQTDFAGNNAFWFAGNSLHTCLGYLTISGQPDRPGGELLPLAHQFFTNYRDNHWVDDYGWWGIALLTALENRARLGYSDASWNSLFAEIESSVPYCWEQMASNWDDSPYAADAPVKGGVWNIRNKDKLAGRNSVTNELFWILSSRLNGKSAKARAESQWFQQWVNRTGLTPGVRGILNAKGLVLERPTGNRDYPDWYWTGDQGLFLSGLHRFGFVDPPDIGQSILNELVDPDGVVHEKSPGDPAHKLDYATGKGILLRYMGEVNTGTPGQPYSDFIKTNAESVWRHRLDKNTNQFGYNWNPPYPPEQEPDIKESIWALVLQTAGQDALNAAMLVAPSESFSC